MGAIAEPARSSLTELASAPDPIGRRVLGICIPSLTRPLRFSILFPGTEPRSRALRALSVGCAEEDWFGPNFRRNLQAIVSASRASNPCWSPSGPPVGSSVRHREVLGAEVLRRQSQPVTELRKASLRTRSCMTTSSFVLQRHTRTCTIGQPRDQNSPRNGQVVRIDSLSIPPHSSVAAPLADKDCIGSPRLMTELTDVRSHHLVAGLSTLSWTLGYISHHLRPRRSSRQGHFPSR